MTTLFSMTLDGAQAATVTGAFELADDNPESLLLQANFTYGSGGTTADAWVQTSLDSGATWIDIANFHFTTASLRYLFNLSALTPVTTEYAATDGTLAANTAKDGIIGPFLRVKYVTTGTYAGSTTLRIDATTRSGISAPYSG